MSDELRIQQARRQVLDPVCSESIQDYWDSFEFLQDMQKDLNKLEHSIRNKIRLAKIRQDSILAGNAVDLTEREREAEMERRSSK